MSDQDWESKDRDDFVDAIYRRTEELFAIDDLIPDADGFIEAAVIPLKGVIIFPQMVSPLFVGRGKNGFEH